MSMILYALAEPDTGEIRYIGITTKSMKVRLQRHLTAARQSQDDHRTKWIKSLLDRGLVPKVNVLRDNFSTEEELKKAEIEAIAEARLLGWRLVNTTDGGDGTRGYKPTPEARARMSAARKAFLAKPGVIEELRKRSLSFVTEERRSEVSAHFKALWTNPTFRQRALDAQARAMARGGWWRPGLDKACQAVRRAVVVSDGRRFDSQTEAAAALSMSTASVNRAVKTGCALIKAGGVRLAYAEETC